jgi:hypothetical protein
MRARLILVGLGLVALTILSLGLHAQPPAGQSQDSKDDILTNEQQLARQFAEFQDMLLRLKQRLARGTPEERKRAEELDKVLDRCKNLAINQEFSKMLEILRVAKTNNTDDLEKLKLQSETIARNLREILDMLQASKGDRLSQDRKDLEKIIKDLERAINVQKQVQGQTDLGKTDKDELKANQNQVTAKTAKVENEIQKYLDKDNKNGEAANLKGGQKDAGKGDGKKGETKDAGKQPSDGKKGETKEAGKEAKGPKGEAKPAEKKADGEPKAGSKSGEKSGAEPKEAGAKGNKSGDPKKDGAQGSAKDNKSGEQKQGAAKDAGDPKKAGPQGAAKGDDKKPAGEQAKGSTPESKAKPGNPEAKQQAGAKQAKGGEKASEAKASGDPKQGEAKAGDSKDGQGQAKDGGAPAQPGQPPPAGQAAQKSDGQSPQAPPSASKQDQDVQASAKKIKEAGYDQKSAEDNIKKGDNPQASKQQGDAIDKMEAAKKKLERLLQQLREEEIERVLAALQARCEKMLMMQQQVLGGTQDTEKVIQRNSDKKPTRENKLEALKLADKEKEIVQEANKCIDILEAEGSAVAFPEVFQQIRQDMIHVQKRLEITDVADVTQGIERDIIDTLKEMIEALKKARQENSEPSKGGKGGKAGDQKLLELIQELKMVRSLQQKVNKRTTEHGKRYAGEQANDPAVIRDLRQLSERQMRIQEIVSRISKGDNK